MACRCSSHTTGLGKLTLSHLRLYDPCRRIVVFFLTATDFFSECIYRIPARLVVLFRWTQYLPVGWSWTSAPLTAEWNSLQQTIPIWGFKPDILSIWSILGFDCPQYDGLSTFAIFGVDSIFMVNRAPGWFALFSSPIPRIGVVVVVGFYYIYPCFLYFQDCFGIHALYLWHN